MTVLTRLGSWWFTGREFIKELLTVNLRRRRQVAQRREAERRRWLGLGRGDFKDADATIGGTAHCRIHLAIPSAGGGEHLKACVSELALHRRQRSTAAGALYGTKVLVQANAC